jgi:uncharacterized pyridoxal phosphate-containing UPF0001 family protein
VAALTDRLHLVRQRIDAAGGAGRVTLVAVTKGLGADVVLSAVEAGLDQLGENYAAELRAKADQVSACVGSAVAWHYLGAVQRQAAALGPAVAVWQGVDGAKAGGRIAAASPGAAVFVQVNLSGQPQRQGCAWAEAPALAEALVGLGLEVRGLMGVAGDDPAAEFSRLVKLAADLGLAEVSAGMSGDFEVAVDAGATMVRLGTALFGPRPARPEMRR